MRRRRRKRNFRTCESKARQSLQVAAQKRLKDDSEEEELICCQNKNTRVGGQGRGNDEIDRRNIWVRAVMCNYDLAIQKNPTERQDDEQIDKAGF